GYVRCEAGNIDILAQFSLRRIVRKEEGSAALRVGESSFITALPLIPVGSLYFRPGGDIAVHHLIFISAIENQIAVDARSLIRSSIRRGRHIKGGWIDENLQLIAGAELGVASVQTQLVQTWRVENGRSGGHGGIAESNAARPTNFGPGESERVQR